LSLISEPPISSYDVLPYAIQKLKAAGYDLVTLAECLGTSPYQSVGQASSVCLPPSAMLNQPYVALTTGKLVMLIHWNHPVCELGIFTTLDTRYFGFNWKIFTPSNTLSCLVSYRMMHNTQGPEKFYCTMAQEWACCPALFGNRGPMSHVAALYAACSRIMLSQTLCLLSSNVNTALTGSQDK